MWITGSQKLKEYLSTSTGSYSTSGLAFGLESLSPEITLNSKTATAHRFLESYRLKSKTKKSRSMLASLDDHFHGQRSLLCHQLEL